MVTWGETDESFDAAACYEGRGTGGYEAGVAEGWVVLLGLLVMFGGVALAGLLLWLGVVR